MARISDEILTQYRDLFAELGHITSKRMVGGAGLWCEGKIFTIIDDGQVYIKADDVNEHHFLEVGCVPFTFEKKDGSSAQMRYYAMSDSAMDDPAEASDWARLGVEAAGRKP